MISSSAYLRSFCALVCVLATTLNATAADKVEIRSIGFDGYFAVGRITPLTVDVTLDKAAEAVVRVSAPDPQGNSAYFQSAPVSVSAGTTETISVEFQSGQLGSPISVDILVDGKVVAGTRKVLGENSGMLSPGVAIVGMLGNPQGLPQWFNARRIEIPFAAGDKSKRRDDNVTRTQSEAKALADEVIQKLESGKADFDELQLEYSESSRTLGVFTENSDTANIIGALRTVTVGSIDGPFKIDQSYHIFKRERLPTSVIAEQQSDRLFLDLKSSALPKIASGFSAIDSLVIAADYDLSEQQVQAVSEWVHYGGHLLVSVGKDVDSYLKSPLGKELQRWIPIEPSTSRLSELPGFSSFADSQSAIAITTGMPVTAARIGETPGVTLVSGSDGPLVEQRMVGFGRVTLVGVDIADGPLVKRD
ncbi:MAG: peptidylprolyl isomerase, partial [Planctomycetaceae bacterium]